MRENDLPETQALSQTALFEKLQQTWLGFSKSGNEGRGLGLGFAGALNRNLSTIFLNFGEETITQSSHLEKLCLVRDGVGRDNISDFTTNLIKGFLADYTNKFSDQVISDDKMREVLVNKTRFNYETRTWMGEKYKLP